MDRDWRRRPDPSAGAGQGSGSGIGKRSLTESIAPAEGAGPVRGLWPTGTGAGTQPAQPGQRPTRTDGVIPRLNLFSSKASDGADGTAEDAEAAASEPDASGAEGEGKARGWGISSLIDGAKSAVTAVKGAALAVAGIPMITHHTQDRAPGASNTRTTVGVGEMITFSSNMPGKWKADKGAKGFPKKASGDQFIWAAMSTKGSAKITFDPGIKGQPKLDVVIQVIAPTVDYINARAVSFPGQGPGKAGVQMETDVKFGPDTVSFANTMWWEKPGPATGATGYFQDHVRKRKMRLPYHHPNPDDVQIDENNSGIVDAAGWWDFDGPYSDGSFEWVIPTYYRVVDDSRHLITRIHQKCTIAADGTMTVTKGSSTMSRKP